MPLAPREIFTRLVRAIEANDPATLERMVHPDFVADMPQSGERVRSIAAIIAQNASYPTGPVEPPSWETDPATIVAGEERWAISPAYTVIPLAVPNRFTIIQRAQYPDGSWWRVIILAELRDDKVYRTEFFFAPEMPPPLGATIGRSRPADGSAAD
jgi:hypothetical protein